MKTSSDEEHERRLQDFFKTSSSRRMFAGIKILTAKTKYLKAPITTFGHQTKIITTLKLLKKL